ncbi:MAG: ABC transporter permease subunit [Sedimentisphaerales bacterium]|nr:ABC transporter permease subunit [Sedimentisphaerales bacterium]
MNNKILNILEYINPNRFFGPIFMKELIISSRRRRNYFVRFLYPIILSVFVLFFFSTSLAQNDQYSSVIQASKMAQIGSYLTTSIVWFQFIFVQILAIAMLSTAISDEIYQKTLGVLMTTPISSFQIVFGKLLSKLFQLILLIAISFPVLAIIRVFGGVPWSYVLSSICVTLTTAIFAGSLSLFFSIYSHQSHRVISRVLGTYFFIYVIPRIAQHFLNIFGKANLSAYISKLYFFNPFMLMQTMQNVMQSPTSTRGFNGWVSHCIAILGFSLVILLWSCFSVRKVGLKQITGQGGLLLTRKERNVADKKQKYNYNKKQDYGKIRAIKLPPVIWREFSNSLVKTNNIMFVFSIILAVAFIITAYSLCIYYEVLNEKVTHVIFVLVYFFIGLLRTSTFASTSITTEREARSWPILLTTALRPKDISYGKIIGSCFRAWPYWFLLAAHMIVFIPLGMIKVAVLIPMTVLVISSALLVSSIGVMFSSICKRSTTAATWNMITFLTLIIPVCCIPFFYFGSPLFAAASIFGVWGGYFEMIDSFHSSPSSPLYIIEIIVASHFSFIIYSIIYMIITYIAYGLSINHMRWRILD